MGQMVDDGTDGRDGWMDGKLHEKRPRRPLMYVMCKRYEKI